ncbi:aldo/keto reductase [Noviherbaspirillum sp.]|uniref:aldo/keto reductase n=1 Tax=Noviherbaspirillum sp. TaxID=1926288 RepID=UPI002FDFC2FD
MPSESQEKRPRKSGPAKLGLGTYRQDPATLACLLDRYVGIGGRDVDTASNYGNGFSQHAVGKFHQQLSGNKLSLKVSTKIGFVPSCDRQDLIQKDVISQQDITHQQCFSKSFLRYQINKAVTQLGSIDTIFLHNPDQYSQHVDFEKFEASMLACIEELEAACSMGLIKRYGIATWAGFRSKVNQDALSLGSWVARATRIAGTANHLSAIQLPVSLIELDAIEDLMVRKSGVLAEAEAAGIEVISSAPLHGGCIPKQIDQTFCDFISPGLSAAQASVLFAFSVPGIDVVLIGPRTVEQLTDIWQLQQQPRLSVDKVAEIISLVR